MDIGQLQQFLGRVYDPATPREERAALSSQLTVISNSPTAWTFACKALSSPLDPATTLFLLSILETLAKSPLRWRTAPPIERSEVREVLTALSRQPEDSPVRRKANQVLVLVGLQECLTSWTSFAQFVCGECEQGRVGLMLAACDIFGSQMSPVSKLSAHLSSRQLEVRAYIVNVASPLFTQTMAPMMQSQPMLLKAATSLMDWVLVEKLNTHFLEALLICCDNPATASPALIAISQLLDRNYTPPQMADFVKAVCVRAISSLELASPARVLEDQDLCNAVLCFVAAFAKRFLHKADAHISITRFLELFFNFTLALLNNIGDSRHVLQALGVWQTFVDEANEFETESGTIHPFASTVMSPLLYRLLERFLYCKCDPGRIQVLASLEESRESLELEDEDDLDEISTFIKYSTDEKDTGLARRDETIDCDLAFFVRSIVILCQRAALMPLSSAASVGQVLESSYAAIQSEGAKLNDLNANVLDRKRAARDLSSLLQAVNACSSIFARPDVMQLPAVAHLASWTAEIVRMSLQQQMWSRGPAFLTLGAQAIVCCGGFLPWASVTGNVAFIEAVSQLALETLQTSVGCPEVAKKQAIGLLQVVTTFSTSWLALVPSILTATNEMNDFLRGETYALFALATSGDESKFRSQFNDDITVLCSSDSMTPQGIHKLKRSLLAMNAVVGSTAKRPETNYKMLVYQVMGQPLIQASVTILGQQGMPQSAVRIALDVLDACIAKLRRQMGDETCAMVIAQCLHSESVLGHEKLRERVLILVKRMVQEPTNTFDSNLPAVLELISNLMKSPASLLEVADRVEDVCYEIVLAHMGWLESSLERLQFVAECMVGFIDLAAPPDLVRQTCAHLIALNNKHRAFRSDSWRRLQIPERIVVRALAVLSSGVREMIADELTELAARCLSMDPQYSAQYIMPALLAAFPNHVSAVNALAGMTGKDNVSLMEAVLSFSGEVAS